MRSSRQGHIIRISKIQIKVRVSHPRKTIKMEKLKCPKCGNEENFHINYDYTQKHMPVIDVLCNECGEFFNNDIDSLSGLEP